MAYDSETPVVFIENVLLNGICLNFLKKHLSACLKSPSHLRGILN